MRASGDCAGAVVAFRKAYSLYPGGLGSLRNIGECEEQIGHFASSRRAWLDLQRALLTTNDPRYAGWDRDAQDAAARLAPKVATLTVDVNVTGLHGETVAADAVEVTINGEKLPTTLVGTQLDRDPGKYVVRVGGATVTSAATQEVTLAAGDGKRLSLHVVVRQVPGSDEQHEQSQQAQDQHAGALRTSDDPGAGRRTAGWIIVAFGGAALVGAGISFGVRQSALGQLQSKCPDYASGPCDPSVKPTVDEGVTASTAFNVLAVTSLVAVAAGLVLVTTAPHGARAALVVGPGTLAASWRF